MASIFKKACMLSGSFIVPNENKHLEQSARKKCGWGQLPLQHATLSVANLGTILAKISNIYGHIVPEVHEQQINVCVTQY